MFETKVQGKALKSREVLGKSYKIKENIKYDWPFGTQNDEKRPNIETTKNAFRASETFLFKRYGHFEFSLFSSVNIALILKIFFKFLSFLRVFFFLSFNFSCHFFLLGGRIEEKRRKIS